MDYLIIVLLGAAWGSFANVCIYRLPKNDPITTGRSYCPYCKKKIKWFDNIPVLSFIFLMAKCRFCKKPINIQYFIVEKISLISFVVIQGLLKWGGAGRLELNISGGKHFEA